MPVYDFDIAVIGGGAAGLTVTAGAAQLGAATLLIEKAPSLGGDCLHYGCVPSKTLIRSANVYHLLNNSREYGLPGVRVGPVDFRDIGERIRRVIGAIQEHDSTERFRKLGAAVEFGTPEFIDEYSVRLNGKSFSAKNWVIATGSSPAPPVEAVLDDIDYITNREIFSLEKLPTNMIILGAGPIAVEMAQAFNRLGSKVQMVQRSGQILSREDKDMADTIMETLQKEGVEIHLNAMITSATEQNGYKEITIIDSAGRQTVLSGDTVLVARGRTPNVHGLGLKNIDIKSSARGLRVDNRMRTAHKHIYAPGDVNGAFQFTHAAGYEGGIVVSNAVFHLPRKADYRWMPWCTYTDPELASIGMNEKTAREAGIEYQVWIEEFENNDRALTEGRAKGKLKMLLDQRERAIGVQIAGPNAGDLIGEWAAVLNGGVKMSVLAGSVHPYPTLAEINKRMAGTFFSSKIFSGAVKKGLKFFFQLKGPVREPCSKIRGD